MSINLLPVMHLYALHSYANGVFSCYFQDSYCHTILEQQCYALFNVRVVEVWLTMKLTVYGV